MDTQAAGVFEGLKVDPDWKRRKGYDPDFLGVSVPLPKLSRELQKETVTVPPEYRLGRDAHVLHYHHYSVAMSKSRRFAWYSAAIIDGDRRPKLPKREADRWFIDPRIDDPKKPQYQCGEDLYKTADTDRGHLTRYLDVAWGDTAQEAIDAQADTFHFTNCCLQLSGFNQGKDRWQGIERYLLEKEARKEKRRIVVMTGPIFTKTDPTYQNKFMKYKVRVPLTFWKVCGIIRRDGTLSGTAFILAQEDIKRLPGFQEALDVSQAQVTIADLQRRTGLTFPVLNKNDNFGKGVAPGALEMVGGGTIKPLRDYEDIVV